MANKPWQIIHRTFEGNDPRPIVVHLFYGDTEQEVRHVYESHRKSDRFLKECDDRQCFNGNVPCRSEAVIRRT